jgi:hypothetical protein
MCGCPQLVWVPAKERAMILQARTFALPLIKSLISAPILISGRTPRVCSPTPIWAIARKSAASPGGAGEI